MHHDHVGRVLNSYSDFVAIPEDDLGRDLSRSRSVSVAICLSRDLSRSRSVTVAICLSRDLSRSRSVTVAICLGRDLSRSRLFFGNAHGDVSQMDQSIIATND